MDNQASFLIFSNEHGAVLVRADQILAVEACDPQVGGSWITLAWDKAGVQVRQLPEDVGDAIIKSAAALSPLKETA